MREAVESVVRRGALSRASFGDPLARLYLATFLLSLTIYSPILVLFYTGRGLSLFQILALEAFNSAVILMAEVPSGVLGDRIGLKKTMFLGYALQGVWIVILIFSHSYPLFLLGYAMLGMAIALRSGATEAWIYEFLVERGQPQLMTRAQGALWSWGLAGRIASALLSVIVVRSATDGYFVLALALSAASFFLAAVLITTIRDVRQHEVEEQPASLTLVADGVKLLRSNPKLRRIAILTVLTDPMQYALLFLYQPYFEAAGTPLPLFGIAAAAGAGVGALSARWAHRLEGRVGMRRAFLVAVIAPSLVYLLMAGFEHPYLAVALYVAGFGLMQLREPLVATMRNIHIQSYNRATALSLISMGVGAWTLGGKLLVGWIADQSLSYAFLVLGVVPLLGLALFRLSDVHLTASQASTSASAQTSS